MSTKTESGEFHGKPTLSIWKVDGEGCKVGEFPVIAFGLSKARAILENMEAIKKFVADKSPTPKSD